MNQTLNQEWQRRIELMIIVVMVAMMLFGYALILSRTEDRYTGRDAAADRDAIWAAICETRREAGQPPLPPCREMGVD